jgi:transcriptional regulator
MARSQPDRLDKLDVPQGTLDLMILTILAREPLHGYGISRRLAELSHDDFQVNPGSLFPSLYRLEQDGRLRAEWRASENNRNAKYYALTASGRRQLDEHRRRWHRISFAIASVLEGA